jgi:hypothetical protein
MPGVGGLVIVLCLLLTACDRSTVPAALSDRDFWKLVESLSESPGTFSLSENLVSNEPLFAESVRVLRPGGGVYIGVGPEQNFSYIARLRPSIAFVIDIRRENRNLHLMYKALFELSTDRADFVSRLFSRPRPGGLDPSASVDDIFRSYEGVRASADLLSRNTALVKERLVASHGFPLSDVDLDDIDQVFSAFFEDGPEIQFWGSRTDDAVAPSYRVLMTARDIKGQSRSYLADEEAFGSVKHLQSNNLVVPVVGDFAGQTAIRGVADYVRARSDVVRAFYGSNVAVYLTNEQESRFCANLSALPVGSGAVFVESNRVRLFTQKLDACRARNR